MKRLVLLMLAVALSGCATYFDYCDLGQAKRCRLEDQMNDRLDMIGSEARIVIQCPVGEPCWVPEPERGDYEVIVITP